MVVDKLLRHADAGISDEKLVGHGVVGALQLPLAGVDGPAGLVVLGAVAEQVQEDLLQVQFTAQQVDGVHIGVFFLDMQSHAFGLEADDLARLGADFVQVERLVLQLKRVALELGHIQHIVDERE